MQNLYEKNFKALLKDTEVDLNKWTNIPCSWIGQLRIPKMSAIPKVI